MAAMAAGKGQWLDLFIFIFFEFVLLQPLLLGVTGKVKIGKCEINHDCLFLGPCQEVVKLFVVDGYAHFNWLSRFISSGFNFDG